MSTEYTRIAINLRDTYLTKALEYLRNYADEYSDQEVGSFIEEATKMMEDNQ